MILTEQKNLAEILEMLKDAKKIAVIGCGGCATLTRTGGERQVDEMAKKLEAAGKEIKYKFIVDSGVCHTGDAKKIVAQISGVDAVVVMACGSGTQSVSEAASELKLNFDVFPALNSKHEGIGPVKGVVYEKCIGCGDCVLHLTGGICPVTLCPKNKINGPCGDEINGKCTATPEKRDCAWVLIYGKLKDKDKIRLLDKLYGSGAKDWSNERLGKIDLMEEEKKKHGKK
jgi:hypothetical protein